MRNYKLVIEYDGTMFNGWQRQLNTSKTVQASVEDALKLLLKEKITITGAGRTDTGVSAYNQIANFKFAGNFESNNLLYSLNSILPDSIAVKSIREAPLEFHSRFSAKKREYLYYITFRKNAIAGKHFFKTNLNLDFESIDKFIDVIKGKKSFKSFCKNKTDKHNFYCTVSEFTYKYYKNKKELIFKIIADRFLHSMVRSVLGCTLDIGRGRMDLNDIKQKIKNGEKIGAAYLPGNALFLNKIYY